MPGIRALSALHAFSFTRCRRVEKKSPPSRTNAKVFLTALSHVASAPFHTASCLPLTPPSRSPSRSPQPTVPPPLDAAFASSDPPRATTSRRSSRPLPATGSPLTGGGGAQRHRHRRGQEALSLGARRCLPCARGGGQGRQDGGAYLPREGTESRSTADTVLEEQRCYAASNPLARRADPSALASSRIRSTRSRAS
jgi:hypothetical protein